MVSVPDVRVGDPEAVLHAHHLHPFLVAPPTAPPHCCPATPRAARPPHPRAAGWAQGGEPDEPHWGLFTRYFNNDSDWLNTFIENGFDGSGEFTGNAARKQVSG